jgi:signal transduction histidine kinase/HAMP domain-containing protein
LKLFSPRLSLRTKIIAWSFIPTAIILLLVALTLYVAYQQVTEESVIKSDEELIRLSASELSASFQDYIDRLDALARLPGVRDGSPELQQATLTKNQNQIIFFDGGVYLLNNLGNVVATFPDTPELIGEDWSDRSFFTSMIRTPALDFSNIESYGLNGENIIAIAVPILGEQDEFRGVAVGMFSLDTSAVSPFYGTILKLRIGRSGKAYLIDGNSRVIYATDSYQTGELFSGHPVTELTATHQVGALRTRSVDGRDIVAGYAPVPRTDWSLVVEEDWSNLIRPSQGYRQFLSILLVLGVVIPSVVVMIGVRRITGPIEDFITAAKRISGGDFKQTIHVSSGDELEELADQFNTMAVRLDESYETLELRVAQRTHELTALNSLAAVVSQSLDLNQILPDGLSKTIEVMGMEAGGVFRLDADTGYLFLLAQQGISPELIQLSERLPLEKSIVKEVVATKRPISRLLPDYEPGPVRSVLESDGWKTVVSIPLLVQEEVLGAINVLSRRSIELSADELLVPASIGQQIGVAMDNARLYSQTAQYAKQMEIARQAAEEARIAAEAANAAKTDFLANVSHELRTPLVSINGFARIVQKRLLDKILPQVKSEDEQTRRAIVQIDENLEIIIDEGQRLTTLINNLLDLEKIEAGKMEWHFEPIAIREVLKKSAEATAGLFEGKSLSLKINLPDELPIIKGDLDKLMQVIINLVSNAVKFTDEGVITIKAETVKDDVVISVTDPGIGIAPSDQALVFEKFQQVGDPLTEKPKGTGLGLAISKEIVEHHGGRIWFQSKPGEGSKFSFSIPVYHQPEGQPLMDRNHDYSV